MEQDTTPRITNFAIYVSFAQTETMIRDALDGRGDKSTVEFILTETVRSALNYIVSRKKFLELWFFNTVEILESLGFETDTSAKLANQFEAEATNELLKALPKICQDGIKIVDYDSKGYDTHALSVDKHTFDQLTKPGG